MKKDMKKIETVKPEATRAKIIKKLNGIICSDKMDKTIVIKVVEKKSHPMYGKIYKTSRKIMAHDEKNEYKIGDAVEIQETRPYSKSKSWVVTKLMVKPGSVK